MLSVPSQYNCNNSNINQINLEVKRFIDLQIEYFFEIFVINELTDKFETEYSFFINFLDWLANLSTCLDLSIFKQKLYHIVGQLNFVLQDNNILNKFNTINFPSDHVIPMIVGSFDKKKFRKCEELKQYECNEECTWESVSGRIATLFWSGKCVSNNINDVIYNTFCSELSYKTKKDISKAIKHLYGGLDKDLGAIKTGSKEKLCAHLKTILDEYSEYYNKNQNDIWYRLGMTKKDVTESILIIEDCHNHEKSISSTINTLYLYLSGKKYIKYALIGFVITILVFVIFQGPTIVSYLTGNPENPDKISQEDVLRGSNLLNNIFNTSITYENGVDINLLKNNGINLEIAAGNDLNIDQTEYNNILKVLNFNSSEYNTNDFCKIGDYCAGNKGIPRDQMPQLVDSTLGKLNEIIQTLQNKSDLNNFEKSNLRTALIRKEGFETYGVTDENYNPYLNLLETTGSKIKEEFVAAKDLMPTQNEIKITKTVGIVSDYLKGKYASLVTDSLPVLKETLGEKINYYVLDGHHRWSALIYGSPGTKMSCNVIELAKGKTVENFIDATRQVPGIFFADLNDNIVPPS